MCIYKAKLLLQLRADITDLIAGYVVRKNIDDFEDTYIYHEKYGDFINDVNRGGLKIPGDSVCQWTTFSYIGFHEVVNDCRTSL